MFSFSSPLRETRPPSTFCTHIPVSPGLTPPDQTYYHPVSAPPLFTGFATGTPRFPLLPTVYRDLSERFHSIRTKDGPQGSFPDLPTAPSRTSLPVLL